MKTSFHHDTQAELETKLAICLRRFGWTCEKPAEEITMRELAHRVGRRIQSVSRSLHRASCPPFSARRGKRRIIALTPNPRLIDYLTE